VSPGTLGGATNALFIVLYRKEELRIHWRLIAYFATGLTNESWFALAEDDEKLSDILPATTWGTPCSIGPTELLVIAAWGCDGLVSSCGVSDRSHGLHVGALRIVVERSPAHRQPLSDYKSPSCDSCEQL
jgi:hypothetical protein